MRSRVVTSPVAVTAVLSLLVACGGPTPPAHTIAAHQDVPSALALAGDSVYWTNLGRRLDGDGSIARAPVTGGAVEVLAIGQDAPNGIAQDGTNLFWVNESLNRGRGSVIRETLADRTLQLLAADETLPNSITTANGYVYWNNLGDNTIRRVPIDGGTPEVFIGGQTGPKGLIVSGETLYWYNYGSLSPGGPVSQDGSIMKIALLGGPPTQLVDRQRPVALAVDSDHAYWINNPSSDVTVPAASVMKLTLSSGQIETLVDGLSGPSDIAVAEECVYYANGSQLASVSTHGGPAKPLGRPATRPLRIAVAGRVLVWTDGRVDGAVKRVDLPSGCP